MKLDLLRNLTYLAKSFFFRRLKVIYSHIALKIQSQLSKKLSIFLSKADCARGLLFLACFLPLYLWSNFELYMGKETPHWKFLDNSEELVFLEKCKENYERHPPKKAPLALSEARIPYTIHFIWLGPKAFPAESIKNVRSWIAKHPHWNFKFWTDRERLPPCSQMQVCYVADFSFRKLKRQFEETENWGEKSDILRYEILFQEGGLYADHDADCIQSFEGLHADYDFYCGLETPHTPFAGFKITAGNGLIGSIPAHPLVHNVIEWIDCHWEQVKQQFIGSDSLTEEKRVMHRTYIALTHILRERLESCPGNNIVLPAGYFFAKTGIKPLFSQHFYATAWAEKKSESAAALEKISKSLEKNLKQSRRQWTVLIACLAINCGGIIVFLFRRIRPL